MRIEVAGSRLRLCGGGALEDATQDGASEVQGARRLGITDYGLGFTVYG